MKRIPSFLAGLTGLLLAAQAHANPVMSVSAREAVLRATPSALGKPVVTLAYGDLVEVLGTQGAFSKVRTTKLQDGWIHTSTLVTQEVKMTAGGEVDTGASTQEVSLAGKGFNSQVEAQIKTADNAAAFAKVDALEKMAVKDDQKTRFLEEGAIKPRE